MGAMKGRASKDGAQDGPRPWWHWFMDRYGGSMVGAVSHKATTDYTFSLIPTSITIVDMEAATDGDPYLFGD